MKLSGINLLDELTRPELAHLNNVFRERKVKKGTIVFRPDGDENLVFIIGSGRVRIYLGYEAKEFTLGVLGAGDVYSTHGSCFVQTLEDSTLLVTDVQSVKRCMAEVPLFTRTMVRVLGHILQSSFDVIDGLVFKDSNSRLISYLLNEAASQNDGRISSRKNRSHAGTGRRSSSSSSSSSASPPASPPDSFAGGDSSLAATQPAQSEIDSSDFATPCDAEIELNLTTEQLAQIIGTTRQTVSTLLNNLSREGLLEKRGRSRWYIPDIEALNLQK